MIILHSANSFDISMTVSWTGITPSDAGTTADTTPIINWDDIAGAANYKIRYENTEALVDGAIVHDVIESGYQISNVQNLNDTIFWQVCVVNSDNVSTDWSDTYSFTIEWDVNYTGQTPAATSSTSDTTPLLEWDDIDSASKYKIRYATSSAGLTAATVHDVMNSYYQISDVQALDTTIYWQFCAVNEDDIQADWSTEQYFNIQWNVNWNGISPANTGVTEDTTPLLGWDGITNAVRYKIRYANSSAGLIGATEYSNTDSEYLISAIQALDSTIYWQIIAINEDNVETAWSSEYHFDIQWDCTWSGISPSNNSDIADRTPLMNWSDISNASSYKIRYANREIDLETADINPIASSQYQINDEQLIKSDLFWQVKAINPDNVESDWSSIYSCNIEIPYSVTKIVASNNGSGDKFGYDTAISEDGSTIVVGAPERIYGSHFGGSIYIYKWSGSDWNETELWASDHEPDEFYGGAVDVSADGSVIVVGAWKDNSDTGMYTGSIYIYNWNGASWDETKITATDKATDDYFGLKVAISDDGNTVISTARHDDDYKGAVYVYKWNSTEWIETKITASVRNSDDEFGWDADLSNDGNSIVIGAPYNDSVAFNAGKVYLYDWNGSIWAESEIVAGDIESSDLYGRSLSIDIDGTTFLTSVSSISNGIDGSFYITNWNGSIWDSNEYFAPVSITDADEYATDIKISIDNNLLIAGNSGNDSGNAICLYYWDGFNWITEVKSSLSDYFGCAIDITQDNSKIVVGAYGDGGLNNGAIYIYEQ